MTAAPPAPAPSPLGPLAPHEQNLIDRFADFDDPHLEWRRLFSQLLGTLPGPGPGRPGDMFTVLYESGKS